LPRARLVECTSYLNPVLLVETGSLRLYYGVPRRAEHASTIVVHSANTDTVEALRRLEPQSYTVYAASASVASRLALALGHRVVEVLGSEVLDGARLVRGYCGLYLQAGGLLLAPPCDVASLYAELPRLVQSGAERVVLSTFGAGVDAYLHRLSVIIDASIDLVECAAQWLGSAGTVLDVGVLSLGGWVTVKG
jgi:hypothetical protein